LQYTRDMKAILVTTTFLASFGLLSLTPRTSRAEPPIKVGVRIGEYGDPYDRLFAGGDLNVPLGDHFYLDPALEIVFVDHGSFFAIPVDLEYRIPIERRGRGFVWIGGGPDILHGSGGGESKTELSADLQAGIGVHAGMTEPYVGLKYVFGTSDFDAAGVLTFGIRF